ncbi:hypothetical protein MM221_06435 [Salipaludibacillus sp. LMS25]|uniref:DUF6792 domain-containing protein n=1 Tax=Salipaludibacillus sp. LMS25 TaxID=2924031 RepID=UPI0020D1A0B4|nr:DUF6792 domain-containing protein [Salipaludibacillus sp. LMS25]UTR16193.1 hypothetical protein MM221_06435 [Salipaludibacillus sp. LMS25]
MADWRYNLTGIFAGEDISQAQATRAFVRDAQKEFKKGESDKDPVVIGLSHSLANNNNSIAYLMFDTFDVVHSFNGAQVSYYQLFNEDDSFNKAVTNQFSEIRSNPLNIYEVDQDELKKFTEDYYAEKGANIHQHTSINDVLYAASSARGFAEIGEINYYHTNPDFPGLRETFEKIPDDVIKNLQKIVIDYAVLSEDNDDLTHIVKEMSGIDLDISTFLADGSGLEKAVIYFSPYLDPMIKDMNEKLPDFMLQIQSITQNSDLIFGELENKGYINLEQKEELVTTFNSLNGHLEEIERLLQREEKNRDSIFRNYALIGSGNDLRKNLNDLIAAIESDLATLTKDDYMDILHDIFESHSISELLPALAQANKGKTYIGQDMVYISSKSGKEVLVNISAAMRLYADGKILIEDKQAEIHSFQASIDEHIYHTYETSQRFISWKINDMEQNTFIYRPDFVFHYNPNTEQLMRISIHESLPALKGVDFTPELEALSESVDQGNGYIESYRKAVEEMFDEEEGISTRFDLIGGLSLATYD